MVLRDCLDAVFPQSVKHLFPHFVTIIHRHKRKLQHSGKLDTKSRMISPLNTEIIFLLTGSTPFFYSTALNRCRFITTGSTFWLERMVFMGSKKFPFSDCYISDYVIQSSNMFFSSDSVHCSPELGLRPISHYSLPNKQIGDADNFLQNDGGIEWMTCKSKHVQRHLNLVM